MKHFKIIFQIKALVILSSIFIYDCTRDIPNPILPSYKGDYRFYVQWDSLTNKDTLEIFKYYKIPFKVIGNDNFATFRITDSNNIPITDINNYQPSNSDSILVCYFVKPYTGNIYIRGIRPNKKEAVKKSPLPLTIINPFRVIVDSIQGMGDQNITITRVQKWFNSSIIPESLSTIWNIGGNLDTVSGLTKKYMVNKKEFTVTAEIIDVFNNNLSLDSIFVTISGFHPVIDSVIITKNPYLGEQLNFTLLATDMDSTSFQIFADFNKKSLFNTHPFCKYKKKLDVVTQNPFTDTGKGVLTIFLIDSSGLKSNIYEDSFFIAYKLPAPVFDSDWLTISINKPYTIRIVDTNFTDATLYRWQIKRLGIDSTTYSDSFTVIWADTLQDTVIISGMDGTGYRGPHDILIVKPEFHSYTMHRDLFPQRIQAFVLTTFQVIVKDENGTVVNDRASFEWFVENESTLDSVYRNRDTLRIRAGGKTNSFSMSVRAIVNESDTTNTIVDAVSVVKIPECVFTQSSYKVLVGDTVTLKINPGNIAAIDSIYIGFDPQIIGLVTETSHKFVFSSSDTIIAYTWAVTDWGQKSEIDSTVIIVYSDPPEFYSSTALFDTSVFINDTVKVSVKGYPGNNISTITHYFWDLNGDYLWDDTTEVAYYYLTKRTGFDDTIHVGCINDLGDTAVEFFRFHLVVYVGSPVIEEVSCDTSWVFINDRINLFINATDSNGTVSSLFVDTNSDGQGDIIIQDIARTTYIDTVPLFFSRPGTYKVSVWVHDDDKNESPVYHFPKPITVDQGQPEITGIMPDTVFIMDKNTFTIKASDNKKISEYEWAFNNFNFNLLGSVNSFTHSFSDSGWHRLYVRVKDDENNYSSIFLDSVYVIWAAPHVDSVFPRAVWVVDTIDIAVTASDTNGYIINRWIDWDNDGDWDDSSTVTATFTHWWDTTFGSKFAFFKVKVMDNDSLTAEKICSVFVRKGEPLVWTESDTLYIPSNTGVVTFYVNSFDTNGTIAHYQFDWLADGQDLHTVQDSFLNYDLIHTNIAHLWSVYVKDDDSLYGSDTFYVYSDSAPTAPVIFNPSQDTLYVSKDSVLIEWSGLDFRDSLNTEFAIMIDYPRSGDVYDTLHSFQPASFYQENYYFRFKFLPTTGGIYKICVIAKDQLNSVSWGNMRQFGYPF